MMDGRLTVACRRSLWFCSHCHSDYYMVEQVCTPDDAPIPFNCGGEVLCQSCQCDGKKCECCGVAETYQNYCEKKAHSALVEATFPHSISMCRMFSAVKSSWVARPLRLNQAFINPNAKKLWLWWCDIVYALGAYSMQETKTK